MYKERTKEEIEKVYNKTGVTGRQAAKELGITYRTFSKKLKSLGIPFKKRTSDYAQLNDKEWIRTQYIDNKLSIRQIAKIVGCTNGAVYSSITWARIPVRTVIDGLGTSYPNGRMGKNAPGWGGGRALGGENGRYIKIYSPDHPYRDKSAYVLEHRLVVEKHIGRYLTKEEIVHHLDGNGHNNDISNLQLTTRKQHFQDHFDAVKKVKLLELEVESLKKVIVSKTI